MTSKHSIDCDFAAYGAWVRFHLPSSVDPVQQALRQRRGFHQQAVLEDIGARLPEHAVVVDVGAGIGNQAVFFGKVLGATVIACEPNPTALSTLRANITINGLDGLTAVLPIAVSASAGKGCIAPPESSDPGRVRFEPNAEGTIDIRSLDEIVGDRHVDLLRIGASGSEADVVLGGRQLIARCHPWLLVEASSLASLQRVEGVVRPLGYRKLRVYDEAPIYLFGPVHERLARSPGAEPSEGVIRQLNPRHLQALPVTNLVAAGLATVAGNELALRATVMSLLPQVDRLFVYLNGFRSVPSFLRENPKIRCTLDPEGVRYGDAGKFWGLEQVTDSVYLACDDDIIYPEDFVARMVGALARIRGRGAVGVHGSLIPQPASDYYDDGSRAVFHLEHPLMRRRQVHVVATSACAFHSSSVRVTLADFRHPGMADIWLARYLQSGSLPAYVIPRRSDWLISGKALRQARDGRPRASDGMAAEESSRTDEVLAAMYPISLLKAPSDLATVVVHVLDADDAEGVGDFVDAVAGQDTDPVILIVCDEASPELRAAALRTQPRCEVHLLTKTEGISPVYGQLVASSHALLRVWRLRNGTDLRPLPAGAWKRLLAASSFEERSVTADA